MPLNTNINSDSFTKTNLERALAETKKADGAEFDLVVVGGGVHGAFLARDAAFRGYSVLLLEQADFASGTSSRSSKMLHGGIRYLESGDVKLVFDALAERARMLEIAPHLTREQEFYYPIIKGRTRPAWQTKIGLTAYDYLAKTSAYLEKQREFAFHSSLELNSDAASGLKDMGLNFEHLFLYRDAQMNDARVVLEAALDARELGATVLNHAKARSFIMKSKKWEVNWDRGGQKYKSTAGFIFNLTGPFANEVKKFLPTPADASTKLVLSRGVHLLFNKPWEGPGLILPTGEKGRYYFVWPHFHPGSNGTLVGTTDDTTKNAELNPEASEEEIEQLLSYLKRDLPEAGFSKQNLYKTFCGIRALAAQGSRGDSSKSSKISRKEVWQEGTGYLSLIGGKFTNARGTAEKGIDIYEKKKNLKSLSAEKRKEIRNRFLPGSAQWKGGSVLDEIYEKISRKIENLYMGLSLAEVNRLSRNIIERFGAKALDVIALEESGDSLTQDEKKAWLYLSKKGASLAEIKYAVRQEMAVSIDDILDRRLGLSYLDGCQDREKLRVAIEILSSKIFE